MPPRRYRQHSGDSLGLVFVFVFLFVTIAFVLFLFVAAARHEERYRKNQEEIKAATLSESVFGKTIVHDGHWWVEWFDSDSVTHHPGCPCFKKNAEEN